MCPAARRESCKHPRPLAFSVRTSPVLWLVMVTVTFGIDRAGLVGDGPGQRSVQNLCLSGAATSNSARSAIAAATILIAYVWTSSHGLAFLT